MDLTLALQRAVRNFPHGTDALAALLGMSVTSLNHKVSPTYPNAKPSIEEAAEIMEVTGDHGVLNILAERLGYVLLPSPGAINQDALAGIALAETVREFGEFLSTTATDLADGRVTANELARIERESAEAIAAIQRLVSLAGGIHQAQQRVVQIREASRA